MKASSDGMQSLVDELYAAGALPAEATARLHAGGYLHNVRVIAGDGATTTPADRPWDRVVATATVPLGRLPYGWVTHTRPGGVIVAPMFADLTSDPLVRFVVGDDGTARTAPRSMAVGPRPDR